MVHNGDGGTYAIMTILGWTVNGLLRADCQISDQHLMPDIRVNRITVARFDELWERQLTVDFHDMLQEEQPGLSREDQCFMQSVSGTLVDGHYSIGLPVKKRHLKMLNNKAVAIQRTLSLKRHLNKDRPFAVIT